jgi:hypothetical protein
MNIPEYMPVLSYGAHDGPEQGACIMEYASFLNGEEWTDRPSCTNGLLAQAARMANDELGEEKRQSLLPLLPRLMGTTAPTPDEVIVKAALDYTQPLLGHSDPHVRECVRDAIHESGLGFARYAMSSAHFAVHFSGGDLVDYLTHLIDVYDRATGRTEPAVVTEDDLRRCAELTRA